MSTEDDKKAVVAGDIFRVVDDKLIEPWMSMDLGNLKSQMR